MTFEEWFNKTPAPLAHLMGLAPMPEKFDVGTKPNKA